MTCPIDWPHEINDETAATMGDFPCASGDAVGIRYDDDQRQYPIPLDDGGQPALFPERDSPFWRDGERIAPAPHSGVRRAWP